MENRIHKMNHLRDMDINFVIIAWRGLSGNKGKPTEQGRYDDGKSAIDWLAKKGGREKDIILYGECSIFRVVVVLRKKIESLYKM